MSEDKKKKSDAESSEAEQTEQHSETVAENEEDETPRKQDNQSESKDFKFMDQNFQKKLSGWTDMAKKKDILFAMDDDADFKPPEEMPKEKKD